MLGRFAGVRPAVFLLGMFVLTASAGRASAHRLGVDVRVLEDHRIEVSGYFDLGGPARGALVQVYRDDGSVLAEGRTDDAGIFLFTPNTVEKLRIVVNAGVGHVKTIELSRETLARVLDDSTPSAEPRPLVEHEQGVTIKDVAMGIGCVLALAAFVLSVRNARQLRELRRKS